MLPVGKFNKTSVLIGRDSPPRGALELIAIDTTIELERRSTFSIMKELKTL